MNTITIQTSRGPQQIAGTLFDYTIGDKKYRFAFHQGQTGLGITHLASGVFVTGIEASTISACLGDLKASAKRSMALFVEKYGVERVTTKLDALKQLRPNHVAA
jgi:hypothetical protein